MFFGGLLCGLVFGISSGAGSFVSVRWRVDLFVLSLRGFEYFL